jgi:hypothetical protein
MTVWQSQWEGTGPEFALRWGRHTWRLKVDEPNPGLCLLGERSSAKLLFLDGLWAAGRTDSSPFQSAALEGFERWRNRVEATFVPPQWGGLTIRAAWSPAPSRLAIDLEIQVSVPTVGELMGLEVGVRSLWLAGPLGSLLHAAGRGEISGATRWQEAVDGTDLPSRQLARSRPLAVGAGSASVPPHTVALPEFEPDTYYVEMVQSHDVARLVEEPLELGSSNTLILSTCYRLFGHDLEKGVILRGRLRGCFMESRTPEGDARVLWEEFQNEPLPLGP